MSAFNGRAAQPRQVFYGKSQDSLCCCEYTNNRGETSHILACCCDCEALDTACDRLLTCNKVNNRTLVEMFSVIEDRMRLPSCTGKGAVKVNLDVALPALIVPSGILIGTLHPALTILMLVFMPLSLITCYRLWLGMKNKPRTRMFFTFGLVSYVQMYMTFELVVCNMWEVLLWENLMCTTLFMLVLYALYHVRKDPGIIKNRSGYSNAHNDLHETAHEQSHHGHTHDSHSLNAEPQNQNTRFVASKSSLDSKPTVDIEHEAQEAEKENKNEKLSTDISINIADECKKEDREDLLEFGPIGAVLMKNFGIDKALLQQNVEQKKREMQISSYITPREFVTHVDSRMTPSGSVFAWCDTCKQEKPPRAGHCNVCNACVHCRDHHCVWIDSCIGGRNHRAFIIAILLIIVGGSYGVHLSLTTICTPAALYQTWLLYPVDCRYMYSDFPTALVFVSCVYAMIAVFGMSLVLLSQSLLISSNVTSEELHKANNRGWIKCAGFKPTNHVLDKGLLRNWCNFLAGGRARAQSYESGCASGCDCGH